MEIILSSPSLSTTPTKHTVNINDLINMPSLTLKRQICNTDIYDTPHKKK